MGTAEIRKTASLCKSEFVNKALDGSHALAAVRVIRRTELPIGCAGRGIATGDTVSALGPGPSHSVAHRDVDRIRYKHIAALPHRDIENLTAARRHAAHGWPAVLINNPQRRCAFAVWRVCAFFPRFSPHQNSNRKNGRDPKNQPCCIRYFHTIDPFPRASVRDFLVSNRSWRSAVQCPEYCADAREEGKHNF